MTERDVTDKMAAKLKQLDERNIRLAGGKLMLDDPRFLAAQVEKLAAVVRISTLTGGDTIALAHALGAQTIALCLSVARAEELRVDLGDEAA